MKIVNLLLFYFLLGFMVSCSSGDKTKAKNNGTAQVEQSKAKKSKAKDNQKGTYLCKIDGKEWRYDEASAINERDKRKTAKEGDILYRLNFTQFATESRNKNWITVLVEAESLTPVSIMFDGFHENEEGRMKNCTYLASPQDDKHPSVNFTLNAKMNGDLMSATGKATGVYLTGIYGLRSEKISEDYLYSELTDLKMNNVKIHDQLGDIEKLFGKQK